MAIKSIENSKTLKGYGKKLGRQGIAKMVIGICRDVNLGGDYKEAIVALGKLRALSEACKYDQYWEEKMLDGFNKMLERAEIETQ